MARADVIMCSTANLNLAFGAGTTYPIEANNLAWYMVYIDRSLDVMFIKSTDGGLTWSNPTVIKTGTADNLSVFYDRWAGRSTDKIRCAWVEDGNGDIEYRDIDTASSDALGTQTTVFAGTSAANGGSLTIWTSRSGAIRVAGSIDAGAEDGAWSSVDDGATWGDTIADPSEGASTDQYYGLPGWNADTADEMIIFVDASANGLSVKRYDDSANTWAETAIIADAGLVDQAATIAYPHVAVCVDLTNSRNIVAAWNAVDAANQDLRLFFVTDTTITESAANVVLNATDDCGLCAVGIVGSKIYVFYGGKSDGSETYSTAINIYYKFTTDDGATWSAETQLTLTARSTVWLACFPRFTSRFLVALHNNTVDDNLIGSVLLPQQRARFQIGLG